MLTEHRFYILIMDGVSGYLVCLLSGGTFAEKMRKNYNVKINSIDLKKK